MYAVISDIHGCANTLTRLLNQLPKGTKLIFLGDLIDRGPHSREVVEMAISGSVPTCKGNHEDMCLAYSAHVKRGYKAKCAHEYGHDVWYWHNGGDRTLLSWDPDQSKHAMEVIPSSILDWMQALPAYIIPDAPPDANGLRLFCSHTGYGLDADRGHWFRALWGRHPDDGGFPKDGMFRVFGHTQQKTVELTDTYAMIDTGAAYVSRGYGVLSALMWPSKQVISQPYDESPIRADFVLKDGCIT